jgi:hypothetical protein
MTEEKNKNPHPGKNAGNKKAGSQAGFFFFSDRSPRKERAAVKLLLVAEENFRRLR